jgi:hypothetical protein
VDTAIGSQIELVAGLYIERPIPGVDVADDALNPEFAGTVDVRQEWNRR